MVKGVSKHIIEIQIGMQHTYFINKVTPKVL